MCELWEALLVLQVEKRHKMRNDCWFGWWSTQVFCHIFWKVALIRFHIDGNDLCISWVRWQSLPSWVAIINPYYGWIGSHQWGTTMWSVKLQGFICIRLSSIDCECINIIHVLGLTYTPKIALILNHLDGYMRLLQVPLYRHMYHTSFVIIIL